PTRPPPPPTLFPYTTLFRSQPQVLNYLGYSWVDMNMNLEQGLEMIARAVELRPNDGYIVDSLGWAYYRLGRFEEAVVELEKEIGRASCRERVENMVERSARD